MNKGLLFKTVFVISASLLFSACSKNKIHGTQCPDDKIGIMTSPAEDSLRAHLITDSKILYSGTVTCKKNKNTKRLNGANIRAYIKIKEGDPPKDKMIFFKKDMISKKKTFKVLVNVKKTTRENGRFIGNGTGQSKYKPEGKTAIFEVLYLDDKGKKKWKQLGTAVVTRHTHRVRD